MHCNLGVNSAHSGILILEKLKMKGGPFAKVFFGQHLETGASCFFIIKATPKCLIDMCFQACLTCQLFTRLLLKETMNRVRSLIINE